MVCPCLVKQDWWMPGTSLGVKIAVLIVVFVLIVLLVLASVYIWRKLRRKEEVFGLMRGSSYPASLPLAYDKQQHLNPTPQSDQEATGDCMAISLGTGGT